MYVKLLVYNVAGEMQCLNYCFLFAFVWLFLGTIGMIFVDRC